MNPFNIFTNKNDLVKVLTIGGLFVVLFSLIYPIEKKKELDLRKVELNKQIRTLNAKDNEAKKLIDVANNNVEASDSEKELYKLESRKLKSELQNNLYTVNSLEEEISVLEEYIEEYRIYTNLFFWSGLISSGLGLLFWIISGFKEFYKEK